MIYDRFTYIEICLNKTVGKKSRKKKKWTNKKNILLEASKRSSSVLLWFLYSILISVHFFVIISKSTFVIVSHERYVDLSLYDISVFEKHSQIFESEFWLKMKFKLLIETHRRSEGYENKFDTIFSNRDNSSWSIIESIKLIRAGPIANKLNAYETTFSVKAF